MRKLTLLLALLLAAATSLSAAYIVVLKDGTRYRAREHWTVNNGKAIIVLESGATMQVDPGLIDAAKSAEVNKLGLGDSRVIASESPQSPSAAPEQSSLGSVTQLRRLPGRTTAAAPTAPRPSSSSPAPLPAGPALGNDVTSKFAKAYENVGLFDAAVSSPGGATVHVELTADNEDKVFNAMTATAYMMVHLPQATGSRIDMVELFMKTINGGAAGRFQMSQDDAHALDGKAITPPMYFVKKVIY